tara:strand:+ start:144 stop:542 length:399 start_codon:yes stop_codon:yes gene_type:complete
MANLNLSCLKSTATSTAISTGYDLAKKIPLEADLFAIHQINIKASMLKIQLENISGATTIDCCLSRDPLGNDYVLTETKTDIQAGLTTSTDGTALIRLDVIIQDLNDDILYLHIKTNAGTVDVSSAGLSFQY